MIDIFERGEKVQADISEWQRKTIRDKMYLHTTSALLLGMEVSKERDL